MRTPRNEAVKKPKNRLINSKFLLATAVLLTTVTALASPRLLLTTVSVYATTPSIVVFDFDSGSPPPSLYQNTPFDYLTFDGITAHFSSPSDVISPAFSVQDTIPLGYNMSMFSGQWLYDNQPSRDYLDISFNGDLYSINVTFSIAEPHGGPGTLPSYINLTAYMDSLGNQIGWTWTRGETASEQNTQGMLSLNSGPQPFNLVRIWIPANQPPFDPTDFFVDDIIILASPAPDTTPPVTTIGLSGTLGSQGWYTSNVLVSLSATDDSSGVNKTEYSFDNVAWNTYATPFTVTNEGTTTVYYKSTDNAGNTEAVKMQAIMIDKTVPTGSINIDNGNATTNSHLVTLSLTQSDAVSGVLQVRYSNDGVWDAEPWEAPSATKAWILTSGSGMKTVYYQVEDNAGLVSLTYQDSILLEETSLHDVAITTVVSSKTVVGAGFSVQINVTVQNQGSFDESFSANVYADLSLPKGDEIIIGTYSVVNLLVGETRTFTMGWGTTPTTQVGIYTISAYAIPVAGESDTLDNDCVCSTTVKVTIPGDINGDWFVNITDATQIGLYWQKSAPPSPTNADITGDGIINIADATRVGLNWQKPA